MNYNREEHFLSFYDFTSCFQKEAETVTQNSRKAIYRVAKKCYILMIFID